jgi:hypothetical protein
VIWILFSVALLVMIIVSGSHRLRVVLAVLALTMLLIGVTVRLKSEHDHAEDPAKVTPPAAVISSSASVDVSNVVASDLRMTGSGAPWELTGSIENRLASQALRSITFHLTRSDCYEGALDPSGCVVLWQSNHQIELRVPAQERRAFSSSIWPHGTAARAKGTVKDEIKVVSATGDR